MRTASGILRHFIIGSCLCILPLSGKEPVNTPIDKTITKNLKRGNNKNLCKLLRTMHSLDISSLKLLARQQRAHGLLDAIKATRSTRLKNLGISKAEFLSLAHFINTIADDKKPIYARMDTGLSHTIEFDRDTNNYFIVLEGRGIYIDSGKKKTVSKALCYKKNGGYVVARAQQVQEMEREIAITKKFRDKPGLFKTLGICKFKQYKTIYSKLYEPGSLQKIFEKDFNLSLYEKTLIARNIAQGLYTLHKSHIVHRDLGIKNYLINIPAGKPGRRKIDACIADFGRAERTSAIVPDPRVQGNTTYMAPEGHFYQNLTKNSYTRLDIFALGCVFYRLLLNKKPEWQSTNYVMHDQRPIPVRYNEHKRRVHLQTAQRREELQTQKQKSARAEFEYLILRMLHTDPNKRVTAKEVYKTLDRIVKRLA